MGKKTPTVAFTNIVASFQKNQEVSWKSGVEMRHPGYYRPPRPSSERLRRAVMVETRDLSI